MQHCCSWKGHKKYLYWWLGDKSPLKKRLNRVLSILPLNFLELKCMETYRRSSTAKSQTVLPSLPHPKRKHPIKQLFCCPDLTLAVLYLWLLWSPATSQFLSMNQSIQTCYYLNREERREWVSIELTLSATGTNPPNRGANGRLAASLRSFTHAPFSNPCCSAFSLKSSLTLVLFCSFFLSIGLEVFYVFTKDIFQVTVWCEIQSTEFLWFLETFHFLSE